jgi:hypothetical protein
MTLERHRDRRPVKLNPVMKKANESAKGNSKQSLLKQGETASRKLPGSASVKTELAAAPPAPAQEFTYWPGQQTWVQADAKRFMEANEVFTPKAIKDAAILIFRARQMGSLKWLVEMGKTIEEKGFGKEVSSPLYSALYNAVANFETVQWKAGSLLQLLASELYREIDRTIPEGKDNPAGGLEILAADLNREMAAASSVAFDAMFAMKGGAR